MSLEEGTELESGGFELIIHAENKLGASLGFTGLREGVTSVDIQELKSTNLRKGTVSLQPSFGGLKLMVIQVISSYVIGTLTNEQQGFLFFSSEK